MMVQQERRGVQCRQTTCAAGKPRQVPRRTLRLGFQNRGRNRRGSAESDAGDLLHHLAEVGWVRRDEGGLGALGGARLPLGDLAGGLRASASGSRVVVGAGEAGDGGSGGGGGVGVGIGGKGNKVVVFRKDGGGGDRLLKGPGDGIGVAGEELGQQGIGDGWTKHHPGLNASDVLR
ncbi:uncharacterized protein HKW66_Vig0047410 [Vigna angularis]|uniref:Uncharacterized protein n=1 Tax=Phaseolus angularis TaxID=3914 RepID=A0A8T0L0H6_PHAAN|nr:uncharacterized protein HKW66_Vig0047410 [Vigna angularis]